MMRRMARGALAALLSLALVWGVAGPAAAVSSWEFTLAPPGPLLVHPGDSFTLEGIVRSLTFDPITFDEGASGFSVNFELAAFTFADVWFNPDFNTGPFGTTMAPFGDFTARDAPGSYHIEVIGQPDPRPAGPHDPVQIIAGLDVTIERAPGPPGVPEPGTAVLLGAGMLGLYLVRWRSGRQSH